MCPDTESFNLTLVDEQLVAFVSSCTDVLEKLGTGDPKTDCEQDAAKVQEYVDKRIDVNSFWLGQLFDLEAYIKDGVLVKNIFERFSSILEVDAVNDRKEYVAYELS